MKRAFTFRFLLTAFLLAGVAEAQTPPPDAKPEIKTTRVTVKITDAPVADAIQQFAEQTKLTVVLADPRRPRQMRTVGGLTLPLPAPAANSAARVTIDAVDQPLMAVLADLMKQTGCVPVTNEQHPSLSLTLQPALRVEVLNERTLFVLLNLQMNGNVSVGPGGGGKSYNYQFGGVVLFDPALNVIGVREQMEIDALDGGSGNMQRHYYGGQSLNRADGRALAVFRVNGSAGLSTPLTKLDRLAAEIRAYQAVENRDLELTSQDFLNGGKADAEGISINLPPFDPAANNGSQIKLSGELAKRFRNHPWNQSLASFFRVTGSSGAVPVRLQMTNSNENEVTLTLAGLQGPINPDDVDTITLRLPTKIKELTVPLEMRNVELP